MMDLLGALYGGFLNLLHSLHPRQIRRFVRELPVLGPLAARSVRRRLARNVLVGVSLAAGLVVFLTMSASFRGTVADVALRTADLPLPSDIVIKGLDRANSPSQLTLNWLAAVGEYQVFDYREMDTSVGRRPVIGLPASGRLAESVGLVDLPSAGEVLLPADVARAAGLRRGDTVKVGTVSGAGFSGRSYTVAGSFSAADAVFARALVMNLEDLLGLRASVESGSGGAPEGTVPSAIAVWNKDRADIPNTLSRLGNLCPGATFIWAGIPAEEARRLVGGFLSPGSLVLGMVFVLAGLGVFNVMLLTLLQRKTQLGVMKALGSEDDEVFFLLFLEGALTAAGGMALGLIAGPLVVGWLDASSDVPLSLGPASLVWAMLLGLGSFYLAAWLPATLCRRASPIQLMAGRRLYLNPRSTCAQCGRCGGF